MTDKKPEELQNQKGGCKCGFWPCVHSRYFQQKPDPDDVNLCKGCETMKHVNVDGLCGRCAQNIN